MTDSMLDTSSRCMCWLPSVSSCSEAPSYPIWCLLQQQTLNIKSKNTQLAICTQPYSKIVGFCFFLKYHKWKLQMSLMTEPTLWIFNEIRQSNLSIKKPEENMLSSKYGAISWNDKEMLSCLRNTEGEKKILQLKRTSMLFSNSLQILPDFNLKKQNKTRTNE